MNGKTAKRTQNGAMTFVHVMITAFMLAAVAVVAANIGRFFFVNNTKQGMVNLELDFRREIPISLRTQAKDTARLEIIKNANPFTIGSCIDAATNCVQSWQPARIPTLNVADALDPDTIDQNVAGVFNAQGIRCPSFTGEVKYIGHNPYQDWTDNLDSNKQCSLAIFTYWRCNEGTGGGGQPPCQIQLTYALWRGNKSS